MEGDNTSPIAKFCLLVGKDGVRRTGQVKNKNNPPNIAQNLDLIYTGAAPGRGCFLECVLLGVCALGSEYSWECVLLGMCAPGRSCSWE